VDNRTRNGEGGEPGVPGKGDRMDAAPVRNGNACGDEETRKRQDPEIYDEGFPENGIKVISCSIIA